LSYTVLPHDVSCFRFRVRRKWAEYVFPIFEKKIKTFVCISGETSLFICIELFWQMFVIDSGYWNFKSIIRFS
jgi:hypothetical protein